MLKPKIKKLNSTWSFEWYSEGKRIYCVWNERFWRSVWRWARFYFKRSLR